MEEGLRCVWNMSKDPYKPYRPCGAPAFFMYEGSSLCRIHVNAWVMRVFG